MNEKKDAELLVSKWSLDSRFIEMYMKTKQYNDVGIDGNFKKGRDHSRRSIGVRFQLRLPLVLHYGSMASFASKGTTYQPSTEAT
jgi:hypothetical protein